MPKGRSYREVMEKGLKRLEFIAEQEKKAPRRRALRSGMKPKAGTLFAKKNRRIAIAEAAAREVQIIITYKKTTTGEVNKYIVAPYEYKYRRLRVGLRKMLYAYDMRDRRIKSFALKEIRKVAITERRFSPKWPIKI